MGGLGGGVAADIVLSYQEIGAKSGIQFTDATVHHRAPHRRAMWDIGRRVVERHADALLRLADG